MTGPENLTTYFIIIMTIQTILGIMQPMDLTSVVITPKTNRGQ